MKKGIIIHPDELNKKQIDRAADLGIDVLGIHPVGGKEAADSLADLVRLCESDGFRALIDRAIERGLEIEYEFHAASYLLDRSLFESHPEYFRMDENGERTADVNFCISNEAALDIAAKNAVELAKKLYKNGETFYFWLDDVHGKKCNCEKCRELSASDQQLLYSNRLARELKKHFPNARVPYIAYLSSLEIPRNVEPEKGIFLEYAPMEKYVKKRPDRIEVEAKALLPLLEFFGREDAKALDYWLDNSLFSGWKKPPKKFELDREVLERDLEYYRANGVNNVTTLACFLGEDYEALYGEPDFEGYAEAFKKYE